MQCTSSPRGTTQASCLRWHGDSTTGAASSSLPVPASSSHSFFISLLYPSPSIYHPPPLPSPYTTYHSSSFFTVSLFPFIYLFVPPREHDGPISFLLWHHKRVPPLFARPAITCTYYVPTYRRVTLFTVIRRRRGRRCRYGDPYSRRHQGDDDALLFFVRPVIHTHMHIHIYNVCDFEFQLPQYPSPPKLGCVWLTRTRVPYPQISTSQSWEPPHNMKDAFE